MTTATKNQGFPVGLLRLEQSARILKARSAGSILFEKFVARRAVFVMGGQTSIPSKEEKGSFCLAPLAFLQSIALSLLQFLRDEG
ncbi:hypothetical protein ACKFKH_32380 [Phormidesmis sp. 146-20]